MKRLAKVLDVHPESGTVSVEIVHNGVRQAGVPVIVGSASSSSGSSDLHKPEAGREVYCVVDDVEGLGLIASGFVHPRKNSTLFAEKNRAFYRHPSDLYWTVDPSGNVELSHPSGTYFRVGENTTHENLTGLNHREDFAITKNTDKVVGLKAVVSNGGNVKGSIELEKTGLVYLSGIQAITIDSDVSVTLSVNGITLVVDGTKVTVNGDLRVEGAITASGSITPNV